MKRLTSILLVITLLLGVTPLLSSYSQPNTCININGIKTPKLMAQFETWLNEPNGLNARFLDSSESSFERGQRLFYDLVLNNNQICLSDLTQEMINSITEVIQSYDSARNHTYLVNGLTVSRSQINLGFKAIRDPIILANPLIFAEAIQTGFPIADLDSHIDIGWLSISFSCNIVGVLCFQDLDEGSPHDSGDFIFRAADNGQYIANLTSLVDPITNDNFVFNYTNRKNSAAGRQVDTNITLYQDITTEIQQHNIIDISEVFTQRNVTITNSNASLIIDFSNLLFTVNQQQVGGGAGRNHQFSMFQLVIPDLADFQPQIANPTLWGLFNSSDTQYSILSFDGRDKVFQDMQVRLNLTVTDENGRDNITKVHANFNGTVIVLSFDEDLMSFSTSTPLIVENLEGIATEITDGYNITFIFSLSSELPNGYYWLTNANVTDDNSDSTLVRERWFSFISQPTTGGIGGVSTLSLAPIGPQIMLALILVGLLALGQSNPWFVLAGWISMAIAFGMSLTGQIYIGLGSTDNLLTFSQAFPESFSVWLFRFFIFMQFVYPIRILVLVYERLITIMSSLRTRLS